MRHRFLISLAVVFTLLVGCVFGCTPKEETQPPPAVSTGAWVPEVIFSEEPSATTALARLETNDIQFYAYAVTDPAVLKKIQETPSLEYDRSFGGYNEITFNPAGPIFSGTGQLNPFAVPRIREAMNWLVDREYICEEICGGLAQPRYMTINGAFPDYVKLIEAARALELIYAHDAERASQVIAEEMEKLGAKLVNGKWTYNNSPLTLIFIIRTEDERRPIGDYVANVLEDVGFTVDRQYKTSAEASPIWMNSDPNQGLWHLYTGGWVTTVVSRDQANNFSYFYTNRGLSYTLWQHYKPAEDYDEIAERLTRRDFSTVEERTELFAKALELSMKDSVRVWLTDNVGINPRLANVKAAADLAGGVYGAWLWGPTIRYADGRSEPINIAMPSMLPQPWNPLDGSNWIYDTMIARGTGELGVAPDPYTGLQWPQRIERAEIVIKEGLPVGKTLDWCDLAFAETISVPEDAWVDWDAEEQRFITRGEAYPEGRVALRKSVVYYPADLADVTWHDGSKMSVADFVLGMILTFDRSKEDSPIYDPARVPQYNTFMGHFRGVRIVQESPLVIETYSDQYWMDAELNVTTWFPYYDRGPGSWHCLGLGILAEAAGQLAFSNAKADGNEIEWANYIAGPCLEILAGKLAEAKAEGYIPYEPTLGQYVTEAEAQQRWTNLEDWYAAQNHFWVGTGPFYLEKVFTVEKVVHLKRYDGYTDASSKWERFGEAMIAEVEVTGPAQVTIGNDAEFEIDVKYNAQPYKIADMSQVKYLVFDAHGGLVFTGDAEPVSDGLWKVKLTGEQTGELAAGGNRLEIAVAPLLVSIPTFGSLQFVTVP